MMAPDPRLSIIKQMLMQRQQASLGPKLPQEDPGNPLQDVGQEPQAEIGSMPMTVEGLMKNADPSQQMPGKMDLQEFLSPGMGDQSDISDIMDMFMGG